MIAVDAAPAVPAFVALAGVFVAVAGILATGVFATQTDSSPLGAPETKK